MMKPRLELKLYDEFGAVKFTTAIELDLRDERQQIEVLPVRDDPTITFDECVQKMKMRGYREVSFKEMGRKLGALMAQGLADIEGWHGKERAEKKDPRLKR